MTWESNGEPVVTLPNGKNIFEVLGIDFKPEITAGMVREACKKVGIRKFVVKDSGGETLEREDFPVEEGKYRVEEYNEAK